jgi:hypothetical protein
MAFITDTTGTVISFADYSDVQATDQRLFEANEGLTEIIVEDLLMKSTQRILTQIQYTDWFRDLYLKNVGTSAYYSNSSDVAPISANNILTRHSDFGDLCVYHGLYYYILPKVADFSKEDNSERAKIAYYQQKYQALFMELINAGDWYDIAGNGTITTKEKDPGNMRLHRTR